MLAHSPKIVMDGLVLCLDAGNGRSYPGSGTTWSDLSGNGNHFQLQGSPSFDSIEGFTFVNGTTSTYAISSSFSIPQTELTIEVWYKTSSSSGTGIVSHATSNNDNQMLLFNPSSVSLYGPVGAKDSGVDTADGVWHQVTRTSLRSSGLEELYLDGTKVYSSTLAAGTNFTTDGTFVIAQEQDSVGGGFSASQAFGGQIANIKLYNRALSQDEIKQNFNALRGRFGL